MKKGQMSKKCRRLKDNALRFLANVSNDPNVNFVEIIKRAKAVNPLVCDWDAPDWDVGANFDTQGHYHAFSVDNNEEIGRRKVVSLNFSDIVSGNDFSISGAFSFMELGKAYIVLLQFVNGTGRQMMRRNFDVLRILGPALKDVGYEVELITRKHFETAERLLNDYAHSTAYVRAIAIEGFSKFLDENGLTKTRLNFRTRISAEGMDTVDELANPDASSQSVKSARFASKDVVRAIGELYQNIPRENKRDRFLVCLCSLAVIFGLRSREVLTLPINALRKDSEGTLFLCYFRLKRRGPEGNCPVIGEVGVGGKELVYMGLNRKVVPTIWIELVQDIFEELAELTSEARDIAKKIEDNGFQPHLPVPLPESLTYKEVELYFELGKSGRDFCKARQVEPIGMRGHAHLVRGRDLYVALAREVLKTPVLRQQSGSPVYLSEIVGITFPNELRRGSKTKLRYAVIPLEPFVLADFLCSRKYTRSGFDDYGIAGDDGIPIETEMHGLRRFINDLLEKGGLSELAQAEWFGRKQSQNANYQSKTAYERANEIRPLIMTPRFKGKLPEALGKAPKKMAEAYLEARVRTIHLTPFGMCTRDFSQASCSLHYDCDSGCEDLLLDSQLEKREFLTFAIEITVIQIEVLTKNVKKSLYNASSALEHQIKKLQTYRDALIHLEKRGCDERTCEKKWEANQAESEDDRSGHPRRD